MKPLTLLDILRLLDRSNCGECRVPTCMAFAAAVLQGQRRLDECPRLAPETAVELGGRLSQASVQQSNGEDALSELLNRFRAVNLAARAPLLGGFMQADRLVIHCLGKIFQLDQQGALYSDCHHNPWLYVPLLSYVLDSAGRAPSQKWARFSELSTTPSWGPFFAHRCERPLSLLAAQAPELTLDILDLFAARRSLPGFEADATFLLLPLPRVPFLFCYRYPEGELPGGLSVFLDRTAEVNLDPESLYLLGTGMAQMFQQLALRHGLQPQ